LRCSLAHSACCASHVRHTRSSCGRSAVRRSRISRNARSGSLEAAREDAMGDALARGDADEDDEDTRLNAACTVFAGESQ
jgi:hypothetical protein